MRSILLLIVGLFSAGCEEEERGRTTEFSIGEEPDPVVPVRVNGTTMSGSGRHMNVASPMKIYPSTIPMDSNTTSSQDSICTGT